MTPAERLECPLLRCRKRFPNHEAMLRHLYTCDQLFTGEYWCYECGRAEKFTDGKCKRCLGHPGKRRRIMSVAKNFFSSLGQKSRNQNAPEPDFDDAAMPMPPPPPSYDSIHVQPQEVELSSSSEILEIDSRELSLPSPSDVFMSDNVDDAQLFDALPPRCAAFEPGMSVMPDLSFDWTSQNGFGFDETAMGRADRPSLSVHTHGLVQYRKQHKPTTRTKNLSPSSSLRSNASTETTASYMVSPTSTFSTAWTNAETNITSPMSDGISPGGYLSRGGSNASRYSNCSSLPPAAFISELPANEMIQPLPQTLPENLGCEAQFAPPLVSNTAETIPGMSHAPVARVQDTQVVAEATTDLEIADLADANSLVGTAWDALKAHVSSSMKKLQHLAHNPLVQRLQSMSPQDVAQTGLNTLKAIIEGGQPKSAIEILCFVHVTYSLSIIVHEDDAQSRSKQLYVQAYLYRDTLMPGERDAYHEVVAAIWEPLGLSKTEFDILKLERRHASVSRSRSLKGKERTTPAAQARPRLDDLLEVALFFLDGRHDSDP